MFPLPRRSKPVSGRRLRGRERTSRLDEALRAIAEPYDEAFFHTALILENVRCFFVAGLDGMGVAHDLGGDFHKAALFRFQIVSIEFK